MNVYFFFVFMDNTELIQKIENQCEETKKLLWFENILGIQKNQLINKIIDVCILKYKDLFKDANWDTDSEKYLDYINMLTNSVNTLFIEKKELELDDLLNFHKAIFSIFSTEELQEMKIQNTWKLRKEWRMAYNLDDNQKLKNRNYFISHYKVERELLLAIDNYNKAKDLYSICLFFNKAISDIHPFENWNGRVFFILLDILLVKNWYLPLFINQDKKKYNEVIELYFVDRNFNKLIHNFLILILEKYSDYHIK